VIFKRAPRELLRAFQRSQNFGPVLLAVSIGLAGGIGAIFFRWLIDLFDRAFFEGGEGLLSFLGSGYVIVLPAVGLLAVSFIVRRWAPEAQGHGVPEVMYAVKKQGGRIRPRVALIKAFASALTIGSGGSVGREGPIVQIGCTIGSTVAQWLGLREQRVKVLVACGAAAGIGGTFNAPIAGVIFALEVILGSFAARSFGLVVISSVTATALVQAMIGNEPAFLLQHVFVLRDYRELFIYVALGLFAGVLSLAYVRLLYWLEGLFERWPWHYSIKALIGGLSVGVIGFIGMRFLGGRYLFGVGYDGIDAALRLARPEGGLDWGLGAGLTLGALLLLVLLKMLATSMTLAAGGSGGVFAPALFIGAMAGGAFGLVANALFPGVTAMPGAYALVGMGALFAGAAHAPITSILILFEMTNDYMIIMPLMISVVISYLFASRLYADNIYTIKLRRRGGLTPPKAQSSVLDLFLVADAMTTDCRRATPDASVAELALRFQQDHIRSVAVCHPERGLIGIVASYDVENALLEDRVEDRCAADIMTRNLVTCYPDQPLRKVLPKFSSQDVNQIPVVDRDDPGKLIGVLRREEVFWAYGELAGEHQKLLQDAGIDPHADEDGAVQLELEVKPEQKALCFKKVREIKVPEQSLIVMLRRAGRAEIPRGETEVEPGDVLVLLTTEPHEPRLRRWMEEMTR